MVDDLKVIKKKYGEKMMRLCRSLFPTILEDNGALSKIMLDNFDTSRGLYDDIVKQDKISDFKNYIYKLFNKNDVYYPTFKNPFELLSDAGYDLYECKCVSDMQPFRKYYEHRELLCSFYGDRTRSSYVFFAVKKDVDKIKREDFPNPSREDLYGTSVISIQFERDFSHKLSIKNRYNHTVKNADATFSNNLDNIIPGLTNAFANYYGLVQRNTSDNLILNNYIQASNGKYYKYNYVFDDVYYCSNNVIIKDYDVLQLPKERYIVFDYFILDLSLKKITVLNTEDSFKNVLHSDYNIGIQNNNGNKIITFTSCDNKKIVITLDSDNKMINYYDEITKKTCDIFLSYSKYLESISMNNLEIAGDEFLYSSINLRELCLPLLKVVGDFCLYWNTIINKVDLPFVEVIGNNFLGSNKELGSLSLPSLKMVKDYFLDNNEVLKTFNAPDLEVIGDCFLNRNMELEELILPSLTTMKSGCIYNKKLKRIYMPKAEDINRYFLVGKVSLNNIDLPNLNYLFWPDEIKFLCNSSRGR